jgi:signal transduction histidine kinase
MKQLLKSQLLYEQDIVSIRQKTRQLAEILSFETQDQNRLATAVSELARNAFQYAGGGEVAFLFSQDTSPQTFYVQVSDKGPGIPNIQKIMNGQYISGTGMGVGLIGSKKLMDHFKIQTEPGGGTQVLIGKDLRKVTKPVVEKDIAELVQKLHRLPAYSPLEEVQLQNRALLLALDEVNTKQEELIHLNRELSDTNSGVIALYAELDEKAVSLTKANEIKTSFLSNMTHEFRTPLSSIISLTRLLLDRVDGELSKEQERQVNYIYKSADVLLELVNDLLDLAKVEAGKIAINSSEFDLDSLLGAQRGMFRPLLANNSLIELVMRTEVAKPLYTDEGKVSQILRNLISNALKYTVSGAITVLARDEDDETVLFSVSDSGIGIAEEHLETIFEDFSQIESIHQKKNRGTGLGLPLSRRLANLLGGDIWVESVLGKGSTFYARIPRVFSGAADGNLISKEDSNRSANSISKSAHLKSTYKILLIDDDEASRYILKGLIQGELKAEFIEALDGQEGLNQIREIHPDLIILDLSMPKLSGFEVIEQWSIENQGRKSIPLIVNTARRLTTAELNFLQEHTLAILSKDRDRSKGETATEIRSLLTKAGLL